MTVCVAAICDQHSVVGAADRMLTAGDVQFEPQQTKIYQLTTSIAVMVAGDSSMQSEIIQNVQSDVIKRVDAEPTNWWKVKEVADLYSRYCNEARMRRSEVHLLAPLGLDKDTFITKQQLMAPAFVTQVATELLNFDAPGVSAIITGIDMTGAHIYIANNATVTCQDAVGFAAIGAGYWHADSQLMFGGHTRARPFPETLLLTYSAKKRAEVAPGVGEGTDMFFISSLGSYITIGEHVLTELEEIYQTSQDEISKIAQQSEVRVKQYVEEINRAAVVKEQADIPQDGGANPPTDQKDVRDDAKESKPEDRTGAD